MKRPTDEAPTLSPKTLNLKPCGKYYVGRMYAPRGNSLPINKLASLLGFRTEYAFASRASNSILNDKGVLATSAAKIMTLG